MADPFSVALMCMALNVWHESRGQPEEGQIAVAYVALNRAHTRRKNVCSIITEPKQFTWATGKMEYRYVSCGKRGELGEIWLRHDAEPVEGRSWDQARRVAKLVLLRAVPDPTDGATFYHADYVFPNWKNVELVKVIGAHLFYRRIAT